MPRLPTRRPCAPVWIAAAVAVGLLPTPAGAEGETGGETPLGTFEATFVSIEPYLPPCEELQLFYRAGLNLNVPEASRHLFIAKRQEFNARLEEVEWRRQETADAAVAMQLAVVNVLRLMEEASSRLAESWESGSWWDLLHSAASARFDLGEAEEEALDALSGYYAALWNLTTSEGVLRSIASDYYQAYEAVYPTMERAEREEVLGWFSARATCLETRREEVFCRLARDRVTFWDNLERRVWESLTGQGSEPSESGPPSIRCAGDRPAGDPTAEEPGNPLANLAGAILSSARLEWEYGWLAAEGATHYGVLSSLLQREGEAVAAQELHGQLVQLYRLSPDLPADRVQPGTGQIRDLRMELFELRLRRGLLALYRKKLALEAAYRRQTSVMTGLSEAFSTAWRQVTVTSDGLVTAESLKSMEPHVQALALLAITQKLLGDSLSLLVTTPLKDAVLDVALEPAWGLFGEEVKTSVDTAYDNHVQQAGAVDRSIAVLLEMWDTMGFDEAARFARAFRTGDPMSSPLGRRAGTTLRGLLEDADFISATDGGLPWILAPVCEDPADLNAVLLVGGQLELEANVRAATVRVAAARGLAVENPDLRVTRQALKEVFDPSEQPPDQVQEAVLSALDPIVNVRAVSRAFTEIWSLPQTVRNGIEYLKGNIADQDSYLEKLVELQQRLMFVVQAMIASDFDYDRLYRDWPAIAVDHEALLSQSYEYASAYRRLQHERYEREKLAAWAGHLDPASGLPTSEGRGRMAALQSAQDQENADLLVRASHLQLVHHALTANYQAAADQTRSLQQAETVRRKRRGLEPATVDLSAVAHAFEAEATRAELVEVYRGLYESAVKDVVVSLTTDALTDVIMSEISERVGVTFAAAAVDEDLVANKLYEQLNPWAGKFSTSGVFNTLQGGFEDAAKSSLAQMIARRQTMFSEAQVEGAVDFVLTVSMDVGKAVRERAEAGDPEWVLARLEDLKRQQAIETLEQQIDDYYESQVRPLQEQLVQVGDDPDHELQREALVRRIEERENAPGFVQLRSTLLAHLEDADASRARREEAEAEAEETAELMAAELLRLRARDLVRDADEGSSTAEAAAREADAAQLLARVKGGEVSFAELRRLTDTDDPLGLHRRLLTDQLDISTLRRAVARARKNDPDNAAAIDAVAKVIDRARIKVVQRLVDDFMRSSGLGDRVVAVIQGGAAEGNPEYQGLFGDIDFTVFTREGVGETELADIKQALLTHFEAAGLSLATEGQESSMDTEAFVQTWGRVDASVVSIGEVLADAATKRKDVTRFFSEGGTKWFMNNVAYSGKVLWGDQSEAGQWTPVKPSEGYGFALDMARRLAFLTDPDYTPEGVAGLPDTKARMGQLKGMLKDSKAFLRLVDGYLMSHEGLGNDLYNNRLRWRQSEGEDASYHIQIFKDLEALVAGGAGSERLAAVGAPDGEELARRRESIFTPEDLRYVRWLARMKMKGVEPDPWQVIDGDTDEAKVANALELARWMREKAPHILAETASVWQRDYGESMASGDPSRAREARADARRIATTVGAAGILDGVGAKDLLQPPAVIGRTESDDGAVRYTDHRITAEEHRGNLQRAMEETRRFRAELKQRYEEGRRAVRNRFPPEEELTDDERARLDAELAGLYSEVYETANVADEDTPASWMLFWMRR